MLNTLNSLNPLNCAFQMVDDCLRAHMYSICKSVCEMLHRFNITRSNLIVVLH